MMNWNKRYANEDIPTAPGVHYIDPTLKFTVDKHPAFVHLNPVGKCSHPGCSGLAYSQEFPGQELKCHQHGGISMAGWSSRIKPYSQEEVNQQLQFTELHDRASKILESMGASPQRDINPIEQYVKPVLPSIGMEEPQGIQDYKALQGSTAVPDDEFADQLEASGYPSTYLGSKNWSNRYANDGA
jgi:hypothetical protein